MEDRDNFSEESPKTQVCYFHGTYNSSSGIQSGSLPQTELCARLFTAVEVFNLLHPGNRLMQATGGSTNQSE